jgi:tRNA A58 N-methylase Trm61
MYKKKGHDPFLTGIFRYVVNVPRQCTPIYPKDACSIVGEEKEKRERKREMV